MIVISSQNLQNPTPSPLAIWQPPGSLAKPDYFRADRALAAGTRGKVLNGGLLIFKIFFI